MPLDLIRGLRLLRRPVASRMLRSAADCYVFSNVPSGGLVHRKFISSSSLVQEGWGQRFIEYLVSLSSASTFATAANLMLQDDASGRLLSAGSPPEFAAARGWLHRAPRGLGRAASRVVPPAAACETATIFLGFLMLQSRWINKKFFLAIELSPLVGVSSLRVYFMVFLAYSKTLLSPGCSLSRVLQDKLNVAAPTPLTSAGLEGPGGSVQNSWGGTQ